MNPDILRAIANGGPVVAGMTVGGYLGASFFGPMGGAIGAVVGALFGLITLKVVKNGKGQKKETPKRKDAENDQGSGDR